jgi:hypothetical protein
MSLDALRAELDATADLPLEEAVPRIATALNGQTLLVPLVDYDEATGNVQLLTAKDNEGVAWIYAYTGEDVMESLGMTGTRYGHFDFLDVVGMARRSGFGGIVVDMAEGSSRGIIPDYWLAEIERVLGGAG